MPVSLIVWLCLAVMTAIGALCIAWPFLQADVTDQEVMDGRVENLKAALKAIDKDENLGVINAENANIERSKIADTYADISNMPLSDFAPRKITSMIAFCAIGLLSAMSFSVYALTGSPRLPDQPLAWRIENDQNVFLAHNLTKLEKHIDQNPKDGEALAVMAPIYFSQKNWSKSAQAYIGAAQYGSFTDNQKSEFLTLGAQSLINKNNGNFSNEATAISGLATRLDPDNQMAAFLNNLAVERNSSAEIAAANWTAFLTKFSDDPKGLNGQAETRLKQLTQASTPESNVTRSAKPSNPAPAAPMVPRTLGNPTKEQMRDAAQLSNDDRQAMIMGMVQSLAARLEEQPNDVAGWERLIRSYSVLGDKAAAQKAYEKALAVHADDTPAKDRLSKGAQSLGLVSP